MQIAAVPAAGLAEGKVVHAILPRLASLVWLTKLIVSERPDVESKWSQCKSGQDSSHLDATTGREDPVLPLRADGHRLMFGIIEVVPPLCTTQSLG